MSDIKGCGSHSCKIAPPSGMGVNGPCSCWQRVVPLEREIERLRALLSSQGDELESRHAKILARDEEIKRLREALESWLLANEVWEWLDDDVPLVKRSDEALKDE